MVDVLDRNDAGTRTPTKKRREPPKKWKVVLYNPDGDMNPCVQCVLMQVFQKSAGDAALHWMEGFSQGKSEIVEDVKEIAETRTRQANAFLGRTCDQGFASTKFKCEKT